MSEISEEHMKDMADSYRYLCIQPGCNEFTTNPDGICDECMAIREACDAIPDLTSEGNSNLQFKSGGEI